MLGVEYGDENEPRVHSWRSSPAFRGQTFRHSDPRSTTPTVDQAFGGRIVKRDTPLSLFCRWRSLTLGSTSDTISSGLALAVGPRVAALDRHARLPSTPTSAGTYPTELLSEEEGHALVRACSTGCGRVANIAAGQTLTVRESRRARRAVAEASEGARARSVRVGYDASCGPSERAEQGPLYRTRSQPCGPARDRLRLDRDCSRGRPPSPRAQCRTRRLAARAPWRCGGLRLAGERRLHARPGAQRLAAVTWRP